MTRPPAIAPPAANPAVAQNDGCSSRSGWQLRMPQVR